MRRAVAVVFALAILTMPIAGHSNPWGWLVEKTSGNAVYSPTGEYQYAMQRGFVLDQGAKVETGDNGRVLLVRDQESVFIGPYTIASISAPAAGMKTTVSMQRGKASFSVRKEGEKHFSVETPFMVAVVKGTKFDVAVGASSAEVLVTEGIVEVRAVKSGQTTELHIGQRALVDDGGNFQVTSSNRSAGPSRREGAIAQSRSVWDETRTPPAEVLGKISRLAVGF